MVRCGWLGCMGLADRRRPDVAEGGLRRDDRRHLAVGRASFDVAQIGASAQYQGFRVVQKLCRYHYREQRTRTDDEIACAILALGMQQRLVVEWVAGAASGSEIVDVPPTASRSKFRARHSFAKIGGEAGRLSALPRGEKGGMRHLGMIPTHELMAIRIIALWQGAS